MKIGEIIAKSVSSALHSRQMSWKQLCRLVESLDHDRMKKPKVKFPPPPQVERPRVDTGRITPGLVVAPEAVAIGQVKPSVRDRDYRTPTDAPPEQTNPKTIKPTGSFDPTKLKP